MSVPYEGHRTLLTVGMESSQGGTVTPDRIPGFVTDSGQMPDPEVDWQEERVIGGNRNVYRQVEGQNQYEGGSWTVMPYDGWPVAFALGTDVVSSTSSSPYTHTMSAKQDGLPPTATAEAVYLGSGTSPDFVRVFSGLYATSGEITQNNEGQMEVSLDCNALGVDPSPSSFYDPRPLVDRYPWRFQDNSSRLSMFGSSFARLQDFSVSMETGAEADYYIEPDSAPDPYEATYGNAEYTIDATIAVSDKSVYQELANPTHGGFTTNIAFEKQYAAGETLDITGYECQIASAPHELPDEGKVEVDVEITPNRVEVVVQDTQTSTSYLA